MNAQQLLQEISDYCRQTGLAESTFGRRAVNDGKLTARLRNGGRITTDTLDRIHGFMAAHPPLGPRPIVIERPRETRPAANAAPATACRGRRAKPARPATKLSVFRQPAKISALRQHLQREVGSRAPRLRRVGAYSSAAAGRALVRRRHRRRLGADARDARDARPLPAHAVLRRRQGNQPRGRAAHAAKNVRSLLRTSERPSWC